MASGILLKVRKLIEQEYKDHRINLDGHVAIVAKNAVLLAKKLKADEEIVEIAAWLHDLTIIKGDCDTHHITGAEEAEKILTKLRYPKDRIERVKHCILTHRTAVSKDAKTIEAKCVASADKMAHFDNIPYLFYISYMVRHRTIEETNAWIKDKLKRDWDKMMPEAKKLVKKKYGASLLLLS